MPELKIIDNLKAQGAPKRTREEIDSEVTRLIQERNTDTELPSTKSLRNQVSMRLGRKRRREQNKSGLPTRAIRNAEPQLLPVNGDATEVPRVEQDDTGINEAQVPQTHDQIFESSNQSTVEALEDRSKKDFPAPQTRMRLKLRR